MSARAGMVNLIAELRQATFAGTADTTLAGVSYWTDDQLQAALDRTRKTLRSAALRARAQVGAGGSLQYYDYEIPATYGRWFEERTDGTTIWSVKDGTGAIQGTADYSVNYQARMITFSADKAGNAMYLDARSYDLFSTAAEIWRAKAGFAARPDWKSDNHEVKASQVIEQCLKQAKLYDRKAGLQSGEFFRTDEVWS